MSPETPIAALRNLGPVSAAMLARIGVHTRADLERVGPVLAYRALRDAEPGATLHLLWAMHGALAGERWDRLSAETRAALRADLAGALALPSSPAPR